MVDTKLTESNEDLIRERDTANANAQAAERAQRRAEDNEKLAQNARKETQAAQDDTVRANLSLKDEELPLERLHAAAELACVREVIDAMPDGFASRVGDNGNVLSGGQRQRLNLARALARDPAVLLLDEATSSLDLETEQRVHANLASLGCTRILIAHRLATVQDADRILVLHDGRIVQEGTYDELAAREGLFRSLVHAKEFAHA